MSMIFLNATPYFISGVFITAFALLNRAGCFNKREAEMKNGIFQITHVHDAEGEKGGEGRQKR